MSAYDYLKTRTAVLLALAMAVLGVLLGTRRERHKWTGRYW